MNAKNREIVYKKVKLTMPHCNVCGEMLKKDYSQLQDWGQYTCSRGAWHWVTNTKTGEQYYVIY